MVSRDDRRYGGGGDSPGRKRRGFRSLYPSRLARLTSRLTQEHLASSVLQHDVQYDLFLLVFCFKLETRSKVGVEKVVVVVMMFPDLGGRSLVWCSVAATRESGLARSRENHPKVRARGMVK